MNKLISELQRLYFLDGQRWHRQKPVGDSKPADDAEGVLTPAVMARSLRGEDSVLLDLVNADGLVRAMVVNFGRAGDWDLAATLYRAAQDDLSLPAPAVSVCGCKGYGLWFSLAEPVPVAQARAFLDALRINYLAAIPAVHLDLHPDSGQAAAAESAIFTLTPALHMESGKWSAFIDPGLGSLFVDEPWLEMAPNMERQAVILAGLKSIKAEDFQNALTFLQSQAVPEINHVRPDAEHSENAQDEAISSPVAGAGRLRSTLTVGNGYGDPESFLLAVMNDPSASARHRIAAAKALLPSFRSKLTRAN